MSDRHLNPSTGLDANDGLTPATAWRTVARLNTALAAAGSGITRVLIDTSAAPLYLDQPIILHPNCGGASPAAPFEVCSAQWAQGVLADVRGFKVLAGPYARPDATNYPNVWSTADTQADVVLWEGGEANRKWMNHPAGATFAAVAASLNGTPGSFWTDGTTMYFHPFGSTDPNTDGKTYERSRNQWAFTASGNASGVVLGTAATSTPVNNVFVHHLSVGGTCMVQKDNNAQSFGTYCLGGGTGGTSRVEDCYLYYGGTHLWCQTYDAGGAAVTLTRVQAEQGPPYPGAAQFPFTSYAGAGRTGISHTFRACISNKYRGLVGSSAGENESNPINGATFYSHSGGGSFALLAFENCNFSETIEVGDGAVTSWPVTGTTCSTVRTRIATASPVCDGCTFTYHLPYSTVAGTTTTVRNSVVKHLGHASFPNALRGTLVVENCTIDLAGNASAGGGATSMLTSAATGFSAVTFRNNLFLVPAGRDYAVFGTLVTGQVAAWNNNVYQLSSGTQVVRSYNGAGQTLAQWQASGFDGASQSVASSAVKLNARYRPARDAAAVNAGANLGPAIDRTGRTHSTRNDCGAFEHAPSTPALVTGGLG